MLTTYVLYNISICFFSLLLSTFRSCVQWWKILPPTYKFFLIVIILLVLLVLYLYLQKLVNHLRGATDDGKNVQKFIPNPELPLPPSPSILHQFQHGVVCSGMIPWQLLALSSYIKSIHCIHYNAFHRFLDSPLYRFTWMQSNWQVCLFVWFWKCVSPINNTTNNKIVIDFIRFTVKSWMRVEI